MNNKCGAGTAYAEIGVLTAGAASAIKAGTTVVGSVAMQINDNKNTNKPLLSISPLKIAIDMVTDATANKIVKSASTELKPLENDVNRTGRIASNDPASSGRAENYENAQSNLTTAKAENKATEITVNSGVQTLSGQASKSVATSSNCVSPPDKPLIQPDATSVQSSPH